MTTAAYLQAIATRLRLGNATEHTYRGDLQQLFAALLPALSVTNEPRRQACGAPDYIVQKGALPIGFVEAKDLGDEDLEGRKKQGNKEQFDRYRASLPNLIITDYLRFHFYRSGVLVAQATIGQLAGNNIVALPDQFAAFEALVQDFGQVRSLTISTPQLLAQLMAGKAKLLASVIATALTADAEAHENSSLAEQMEAFRLVLIHDIKPADFADVYAQTIAYGLFAARLHDPTLPTFSRQEAAELIPKTNPFLRKLFSYVAGPDIDDRIVWIVDGLIEIFLSCDVDKLLKAYGRRKGMEDPIIHFYETFLSEYNPALRKARGVWYTPAPVVGFIVRAVDELLKTEFGLADGLADRSKTRIKRKVASKATADMRSKLKEVEVEEEVHRVQILDPATGTGTFLAEVVKQIHLRFEGQGGLWRQYVTDHLLPRLNGFELLMASYAMAHLKLDLLLKETGVDARQQQQRLRIYLTNSLEESHPDTDTLFANWLSQEANEANRIKRDTPVMCVLGNPPYSGESANKGEWIMKLMEDYKKEPGGLEKLKEQNYKWINDDYVKFIRSSQNYIDRTGAGIVAFINPHGYLENPTFRGMRSKLMETFDKIYVIDLHGNSTKKEKSPDGGPDENVFDIKQGVSINLFIKTGRPNKSAVFHFDLYGDRESKYDFLSSTSFTDVPFKKLSINAPLHLFQPKDQTLVKEYEQFLTVEKLFSLNVLGVVTANDALFLDFDRSALITKLRRSGVEAPQAELVKPFSYRPYDVRYIYYDTKLLERPREKVMRHMDNRSNLALNLCKIGRNESQNITYISVHITDKNLASSLDSVNTFPLYLYPDSSTQTTLDNQPTRRPNLNTALVEQLAEGIQYAYIAEAEDSDVAPAGYLGIVTPHRLLAYVYAVLHHPGYRERYKEFLKIDFPRVPYPASADQFETLVAHGEALMALHLMESPLLGRRITRYPHAGTNEVAKLRWEPMDETLGRVWINDTQCFEALPTTAWNFYIGGYQPAQKWLKDRRGRVLSYDDLEHYQKIIVALNETARVMGELEGVEV